MSDEHGALGVDCKRGVAAVVIRSGPLFAEFELMKTETHEIENATIEGFADKHGLVMEIHERRKPIGDPSRYYAHFKSAEAIEGLHCLIGLYGDGSTPAEAIANYARDISLRTLIIDAMTEHRREIEVPRLSANSKVSYHADNAGGAHGKDTNDK